MQAPSFVHITTAILFGLLYLNGLASALKLEIWKSFIPINGLAGGIPIHDPTNTIALEPRPTKPPAALGCSKPQSWEYIVNFPSSDWRYFEGFVSSPELCCGLCYDSSSDCVLAKYDKDIGSCKVKINTANASEIGRTAQCPLGKFNQGHLDTRAKRDDWDHSILGPCFDPKE